MQKIVKSMGKLLGISLVALSLISSVFAAEFDSVAVQIKSDHKTLDLTVEFAHTFEQRAQGLMFRTSLCEQCGMLFQYSQARIASMWMKNTLIPLDVAFITDKGVIVDILPMQPQDLTSIRSSANVLFALEMNQGWFAENGIKVRDKVIVRRQ